MTTKKNRTELLFDLYKMGNMGVLILLALSVTFLEVSFAFRPVHHGSKMSNLQMSLGSTHDALFDKLRSEFDLKRTDYTNAMGGADLLVGSLKAECAWFDEKTGTKFTGVSKNILSVNGKTIYELNVWMGPSTFVPHCTLTMSEEGGACGVLADLIPRGGFAFGTDSIYLEKYFDNAENAAWYKKAYACGGAVSVAPSGSMSGRLLRSPIEIRIGGISEDDASALSTEHIDRFIEYVKSAQPSEARQRGALNSRDDKLREFAFRESLSDSTVLLCGDADNGRALASSRTGPLSEAYVGGGS